MSPQVRLSLRGDAGDEAISMYIPYTARLLRRSAPRNDRGVGSADHPAVAQAADRVAIEAQPGAKNLVVVLAKQWRWLHRRRLALEAHRPCHHLEWPDFRMLHRLHDLALLEGRIVVEFQRVEHRARWHAGGADDLHALVLGVLHRPRFDHAVDLVGTLGARGGRFIAAVANQVLAADHL